MRLDYNGYLLIGYTTSNGAYNLQVNSQIYATNSTIATSDARYKKDVVTIKDGLDVINALNPVSFKWKEHAVHNFQEGECVGFLAQEVEEAFKKKGKASIETIVKRNQIRVNPFIPNDPDNPGEDSEEPVMEEFLGMSDTSLIPYLVSAVQELSTKLAALEKNKE
jgi:hypothetical protein